MSLVYRKKTGGRVAYQGTCALCDISATPRWYRKYHEQGTLCKSCYDKQRLKDPVVANIRRKDYIRWSTKNPYKQAKKSANHEFTLEESVYLKLIEQNCFYCEGPLSSTGTRLDRIDNTLPYTTDNVVPCCRMCNVAKNNHTQEAFVEMCSRVTKRFEGTTTKELLELLRNTVLIDKQV